ncbi:TolC family outer membrane protein [Limnohabitans sp. 103DPR2]|uniref:TolC family outer membrane protein n=1 Tax=Limnohabitans sp. 103DPR2 TaxID=1678129 RepID=UPI0006DD349C|nr:TolC family outer membrane protein [Limnohabitans sp. 103DPR2]ALK93212.1 Outer membrane protein TolC precursor [Limnohabitans sp. 103DPR2]
MKLHLFFAKSALACALSCAALASWAQSNVMDLKQVYEAALMQDSVIRASRAAADSGRERLPQARAGLLPQVSASAGRNSNDLNTTAPNILGTPVTTNDKYFSDNRTVQLRQPLMNMQRWLQFQQAKSVVEEAEANLDRDLQNLVVRVAGAYFETLMADEQLELVQAQIKTYTALVDAAQKGLAAGSGTRTDVDDAKARLDMAKAQELEARQNQELTRRQLETLINQPVTQIAKLNVAALQLSMPEPANLDDWTRKAEEASPEIKVMQARLDAARREVSKAQAGHLPTLDAVAQWSNSGSENITRVNSRYENKTIGLQLNIPLYSGGYVNSTIRQAVAEQTRAEETLEALRRDLGVRVHKEYRGVTEGILRVRALEQAARSAEQMMKSTQMSLKAGSRTQLDVLNAQQQYTLALRDLAQARMVFLLSKVRLASLVGDDALTSVEQVNASLAGN